VGAEIACTVTVGRARHGGKALLETSEIIFRGDDGFRLKIAFASIAHVAAKNGRLAITHGDGTATFDLGSAAETWASKIRNPKTRADKLGVKSGQRVSVINVNDRELIPEMRARGIVVSHDELVKESDAIFVGAESLGELEMLPEMVVSLKRDGCIWTVTPKGKGGVRDTDIIALARAAGLIDVKVVAFSATHSANKFVIPKDAR
jgi:hypothetical protein